MSLGDNIRYLRIQHNYSQDYIAEKLGYKSYTTIQKWESGVSEPPVKILKELALLFNVDMDDLANKDFVNPPLTDSSNASLPKILEYYLQLNDIGRKEAEKRVYELTQLNMYIESHNDEESAYQSQKRVLNYYEKISQAKESIPIAAHERTDIDIPSGVDTSDNDIMDDNNF